MRVKCIDKRYFNDPNDMLKWSKWQYIGYVDEPDFSTLTWKEFLKISKERK